VIQDTGIGIKDQIINKIFEPFFTTKEIGKGTGLGLATVYGIIKQNNGSIWADSEAGKGSRFRVYWPVTTENSTAVKIEKDNSSEYQGKETILLVEDDAAVREFTSTALQNFGYHVFEASNGNQALKLIADNKIKIDLLITDLIMPEMNGKELAEKISAFLPRSSILFTSGYTEDYIVRSGELEAGIHFLQKPYSMNLLAQKVRDILDKGRS
jgi:CheY-like chemotaxis protein